MTEEEGETYLARFDPYRDASDWVSEDPYAYAARMQASLLPHWPTEVLIEWFHRHARHIDDYAFLQFESFRFSKHRWPLTRIPGSEAFADPNFCDGFINLEERAAYPHDWLAQYMLEKGTWNTPVVFLDTSTKPIIAPGRSALRHPLHLLEGHRRLSFLIALRRLGKALPEHDVWVVRLAN